MEDISFSIINSQHIMWNKRFVKTEGLPYAALVFRLHEFGRLTLGDSTVINSKFGDITYVPAKTPYSAEYPGEGEMVYIHFTETVPFFKEPQNFSGNNFAKLEPLFMKIASICTSKKPHYKIEAAAALLDIIVYILNENRTQYINGKFETAVKILKDEYTNSKLNISAACKQAGISCSYFRKLFLEEFGITPVRYINELRIDNAQRLLYSSYCSIENAAIQSGFSDYRYFSRVVKALRGCTPSKLRNL